MDVHLKPETEKIVVSKLQTGHYGSPTDVIDEAVRLLEQRDEIRAKIEQGVRSLREARGLTEDEAFAELRSRHNRYKRDRRG